MSNYHDKKARRIERLKERAQKSSQKADSLYKESQKMASVIPFGQPILIGHHSEKKDRNFRGRISAKFQASINEDSKAKYYEEKAIAAEQNDSISSDNPDAIELLKEKLAALEKLQKLMKEANKIVKAKKGTQIEKLEKLKALYVEKNFKYDESKALSLFGDRFGHIGYPSYKLTNNGANMRTIKKRIESLSKSQNEETTEEILKEVRIINNVEENRLQLFFPSKPSEAVRTELKRNGFKWSSYNGCWQRMRSSWAVRMAKEIIVKYY